MNQQTNPDSPEFKLLQRIDGRLEHIEQRFETAERKAITYGAFAGGIAGAIAAVGVALAKIKLGA
ncbi:hypothetical protein VQ643_04255 [Pseudomonas sp. F1_0610]|uniref:hypothetical protein n=1 Tax=Pseudomonas sp. F1_0610 TaxID=3114284 RepID=UPI0039C00F55